MIVMAVLFSASVDAAVSLVGSGKAARANAGTMTVTAPSSTAAGDVMILFLGTSDTTPLTSLSGWTLIKAKGPDDIALSSLYRVYRSGDSKSINITVKHCSFATVIALRGVDQSNPIVDKNAYKDWGITSQTQDGTGTPHGTSYAPSINSVAGGALVCGFMWDDPYRDCTVAGMSVLHSYSNADDGLTTAYQSTASGGSTGMRKAVASNTDDGGGNEIGMSVSVRPAVVITTTVPWVTNLTVAAAGTAITNAGLVVSGVTRSYHATVAAGKIFSQTPGGNTSVARGSSVALAASLGPAPQLVLNNSFETNTASWTLNGSAIRSTTTHAGSGVASLRINTATGSATQRVAIVSGKTYDISAYAYISARTAGQVVFDTGDKYDAAGQGQFVFNATNGGWKKYSGSFTATNTFLTVRMFSEGFAGTAYFDLIELKPRN
jgi:hypothetical protein